ncbi:acyl-CoA dehydrogenase family protein [Phytohabitans rumicis]|uniref:Putative acyl-CoA dehydrogenase n=1 Tax=Phytohabitans rumicis TaxID=1076125 RepID=A0A6V8LN06_9ACTN|nr:acyl-CoA dehydrogenase family protein [Phytohabitans rumicis]GFJ96391.1 putative acyl-CoA dehydrogenase [Phytohabitans rumicis]
MDFAPTAAQRDLAELTRDILADGFGPDEFDKPLWTKLAKAGVLAATLPPSAGGDGYGVLERCSVLVELGRAAAPVPFLPCISTAAAALGRFGDAAQMERWVAPAGRGDLVLAAAPTGSVRADRVDGRWVLTGDLTAVPAAPYADLILVPADGPGVFLVTPADDGVSVERQHVAGGAGAGWVSLAGTRLTDDRLLGGVDVADWLRAHATVGACAAQLGVTERALEMTAEYARTRVQFGRPIGTFQAVAQRLADAYIDVEAIRLTMWQAAWLLGEGLPCAAEVSTAKFWAADAGHRVAHAAVHVHGGVGIDLDAPLHRYFLAAKYYEFTLGTATDHLRALGATLAG